MNTYFKFISISYTLTMPIANDIEFAVAKKYGKDLFLVIVSELYIDCSIEISSIYATEKEAIDFIIDGQNYLSIGERYCCCATDSAKYCTTYDEKYACIKEHKKINPDIICDEVARYSKINFCDIPHTEYTGIMPMVLCELIAEYVKIQGHHVLTVNFEREINDDHSYLFATRYGVKKYLSGVYKNKQEYLAKLILPAKFQSYDEMIDHVIDEKDFVCPDFCSTGDLIFINNMSIYNNI